jgi:hypothetical protein
MKKQLINFQKALKQDSCNKLFVNRSSYSRNKYGNKTSVINGRSFDSKLEAAYFNELVFRQKAGEIKEIIPQFKLDITINGKHICNYYVDFKLIMRDESTEYHEVKGFATDIWALKWKLAQALYDDKFILIK